MSLHGTLRAETRTHASGLLEGAGTHKIIQEEGHTQSRLCSLATQSEGPVEGTFQRGGTGLTGNRPRSADLFKVYKRTSLWSTGWSSQPQMMLKNQIRVSRWPACIHWLELIVTVGNRTWFRICLLGLFHALPEQKQTFVQQVNACTMSRAI